MTPDFDRDPELAVLLRGAAPEPPAHAVDWERLRGAVVERAELPLAALRRDAAPARPRTRLWLPLGAVAGLAAAASMALMVRTAPAPLPAEERRMVDAIVAESVPDNVDQLLSGAAAEGALLQAAVGT